MAETSLIRDIEETSMNAWPALRTLLYDGWVLRFADGYTRRANSVNPLYPSAQPIKEKIGTCERLYQRNGLECTFKMTPQSLPRKLDKLLADLGYGTDSQTSVQLLDLAEWDGASGDRAGLSEEPTEAWLAACRRMSNIPAGNQATHQQMLRSIVPQKRFASIIMDGRVIACGLGVLQDELIGLYGIVTDPGLRRQGHSQRLIGTLLEWGKSEGARRSYLQVVMDNPPALALYAKLGFREAYRYWYRVKGRGLP